MIPELTTLSLHGPLELADLPVGSSGTSIQAMHQMNPAVFLLQESARTTDQDWTQLAWVRSAAWGILYGASTQELLSSNEMG